jgi:hypothetical protein
VRPDGPEEDDRRERQQHGGIRRDQIDHAHEHDVRPAEVEAGDCAGEQADERREQRGGKPDLLGRPESVQRAAEHVSANVTSAMESSRERRERRSSSMQQR